MYNYLIVFCVFHPHSLDSTSEIICCFVLQLVLVYLVFTLGKLHALILYLLHSFRLLQSYITCFSSVYMVPKRVHVHSEGMLNISWGSPEEMYIGRFLMCRYF
jgi:hypothetical protein